MLVLMIIPLSGLLPAQHTTVRFATLPRLPAMPLAHAGCCTLPRWRLLPARSGVPTPGGLLTGLSLLESSCFSSQYLQILLAGEAAIPRPLHLTTFSIRPLCTDA